MCAAQLSTKQKILKKVSSEACSWSLELYKMHDVVVLSFAEQQYLTAYAMQQKGQPCLKGNAASGHQARVNPLCSYMTYALDTEQGRHALLSEQGSAGWPMLSVCLATEVGGQQTKLLARVWQNGDAPVSSSVQLVRAEAT